MESVFYFKEHLRMERHPHDKLLLQGESMKLCCEASGSPPPDYYEW